MGVDCEEKRTETCSGDPSKGPHPSEACGNAGQQSPGLGRSGQTAQSEVGYFSGAGVSPMNDVPVNLPLASKFQLNNAVPA